MNSQPYSHLVRYKQWADRGLHRVVAQHFDRLDAGEATILVRILDHIRVVDRIFRHHLQGTPHAFRAARSEVLPEVHHLIADAKEVDDWYVSHVDALSAADFGQALDFNFTSGKPVRMTRGEILLHVGLHGTYHRGSAGLLLQKNGITPNDDRMTDFLEAAA